MLLLDRLSRFGLGCGDRKCQSEPAHHSKGLTNQSIVKRVRWARCPDRSAPKCQGGRRRTIARRSSRWWCDGVSRKTAAPGGSIGGRRGIRQMHAHERNGGRDFVSNGFLFTWISIDWGPILLFFDRSRGRTINARRDHVEARSPAGHHSPIACKCPLPCSCWRRPHHPALVLFSDAVVKIQRSGGV